jgi:hypothetical protein
MNQSALVRIVEIDAYTGFLNQDKIIGDYLKPYSTRTVLLRIPLGHQDLNIEIRMVLKAALKSSMLIRCVR